MAGHAPRWVPVWRRNFNVWRKLMGPSLVGNFGEPLLYLLALGYGLGQFVGEVQGLPYILFLASGIVCSSAMNTASFEGLYSAYTRMKVQQTWDGMLSTPLTLGDIVAGEIVWMGTKSLISVAAIVAVTVALGIVTTPLALWVLPLAFLVGCAFGAMALVATAVAPGYDFFLYYFTLFVTPMFLISGVFFPVDQLPPAISALAAALPLSHAVEVVRPLMTGRMPEAPLLHLAVVALYGIAGWRLALWLLRRRLLG